MLLKSLELQGFKSFADKTVLDLTSNITAVVGPNGSGKSNITDAIRWLLGERDARNLRGGKVEDLIFAGTESKSRMGMAQATLYFDNSSKFFPVDFHEVSVSRKVTRDGESLYFLNKAEVRLKDVVDFFAKSKLGARGLTIITQGSSDLFIRSTPLERKEMIEEILGLKEYQLKKTESLKKLKNTEINLETVNASLQELKPHLKFLKRQVSRYEERDAMAVELQNLENSFYGRRFKFLKTDLINFKTHLERIEKLIHEEEKLFKDLDEKLQKTKSSEPESAREFRELEAKKTALLTKKAGIEREFGKLEARIEFELRSDEVQNIDAFETLKEIKNIASEIRNEDDISKLKIKIDLMILKIDEVFSGPKKIKKELSSELKDLQAKLTDDLQHAEKEIKGLSDAEDNLRRTLADFNKSFTASHEAAEAQKKKLDSLFADKNRLSFDIERTELKIGNLKEELMQAGRSLQSIEEGYEKNREGLPAQISPAQGGENWEGETLKRMFKLRGDLAGIGEIDQALIKEAKETEERFNFLTTQVADLESAVRDLKILIKDLDQKIHHDFTTAIKSINEEFGKLMKLMFGGGAAKLVVKSMEPKNPEASEDELDDTEVAPMEPRENEEIAQGIEVEVSLPKKRIKGLDVLSGGERTLVSIAVLFALISVSPPPFLVLDEVDAALDEGNARRCSNILKEFSKKSQFIIVTHNRATMEVADVLYGVTMESNGTSKLLSLKLEDAKTNIN